MEDVISPIKRYVLRSKNIIVLRRNHVRALEECGTVILNMRLRHDYSPEMGYL
jgi:hypothetical protein